MDVVPNLRKWVPTMTTICATETRILRWTFRRDHDAVICELGLNSDDSAYQLRLNPPWNPHSITTELFDDAMQAFQRHAAIERVLIDEGWMLEAFDSVIGATLAHPSNGG
jgi:hypothetical protein